MGLLSSKIGPFMPCQDLFDWWSLRCGVWVVFLMALLGNGAVVFVLVFARSKMDVPRFLVCNLGMADLFMGIYLGFLAVVDASTLGEFRKYAIPWQLSAGCQVSPGLGKNKSTNVIHSGADRWRASSACSARSCPSSRWPSSRWSATTPSRTPCI